MANAQETTFKDWQTDERYKKLERTLKMVLLKNADRKNTDNGHTGTWPSISSINGDNLDTSYAAMSVQSSRIGSEVVASSANFRNIQQHKKQYNGARVNIATSSENQFPINKEGIDSAMMPPPRTLGACFVKSKRFNGENQRVPLLNMQINPGRNNNGFTMSTPTSSISSVPKCTGSVSVNSSTAFQENENYGRNAYEEETSNGAQRQERSFSRWRVLLNDKAQLIIKGTLECGKVARSKPVIRRLTPTSVQSIFKHTYHLQGNLIDERSELPDYVRGKFFNGFPDDWENVYQVWRNYLSDGSRLSFRWPTAVTDSDDDIKSEITEISYRPQLDEYNKSVSSRKRARSLKATSVHSAAEEEDIKSRSDPNRCACSHNASGGTPLEASAKSPESLSRVQTKCNRDEDVEVALGENKKSDETSNGNLSTTEKIGASSLQDIIQEDKLHIIIDNLTNKNCSIEYISKIVQMFDCMKFAVSYQPTGENNSDKNTSVSQEKETSRTSKKKNRSMEENNDSTNTLNSKNPSNSLQNPAAKIDQYENAPSAFSNVGSRITEKSYKDQYVRQARRKLMKHDYDSSESENDYYDDTRRTTTHRVSKSQERIRRSQNHNKNYENSVASRTNRQYVEPEKSFEGSHRAISYSASFASRSNRHDSSLSEEEPVVERRVVSRTQHNRAFANPRKTRNAENNSLRRITDYDSSISITEDEDRYAEKSKEGRKDTRKDQYDSSVSITEDEQGDIRVDRRRLETLKHYSESNHRPVARNARKTGDIRENRQKLKSLNYYTESNPRPVAPEPCRNGDIREDRQKLEPPNYYPESKSRPIEPGSSKNGDIRDDRKKLESLKYSESNFRPVNPDMGRIATRPGTPCKMPAFSKPMIADDNRSTHAVVAKNYVNNDVGINNFVTEEQNEDSAYVSSEIKRAKKSEATREVVEKDSNKSSTISRSNEHEFDRSSESPEMPAPKSKTPQVRKKPVIVSSELTNINLKSHNWLNSNNGNENDKNVLNTPRVCLDRLKVKTALNDAKNAPIIQKTPGDTLPEIAEPIIPKSTSKETDVAFKAQDGKSSMKEGKSEKVEKPSSLAKETPTAKFGSRENPKLLTAWVPAVVYDDEGDSKYHLIFEGKLLNEAGHVVNRKFATDFIQRRVSVKLVETISQEFYQLSGDLNDTKHVVPKELVKLCRSGCPGRIGKFCEKWKTFTADNKTPLKDLRHNTSVDCLGVPTSSRGRRILPPLNYWAGERIATKDNKAVYSPGNSQESSIPSSLEKTNEELRDIKSPSKSKRQPVSMDQNGKRADESKATGAKRKDAEKVSPSKLVQSPPQQAKSRSSQRIKGGKRRLIKYMQTSSSESEADEQTKPTPRKRRTGTNDQVLNIESTSTKKLRSSNRNNTTSSQSLENTNVSSARGSFEKLPELDVKTKLRKRQKIDYDEEPSVPPATSKQNLTRRNAMVTCTHYKNVPLRDDDLSEDQLSTM